MDELIDWLIDWWDWWDGWIDRLIDGFIDFFMVDFFLIILFIFSSTLWPWRTSPEDILLLYLPCAVQRQWQPNGMWSNLFIIYFFYCVSLFLFCFVWRLMALLCFGFWSLLALFNSYFIYSLVLRWSRRAGTAFKLIPKALRRHGSFELFLFLFKYSWFVLFLLAQCSDN